MNSRVINALARFEVVVGVVSLGFVLLFATLHLSGTSVGMYHRYFYGAETPNDSLIFGEPRPIRSDEWLRWTPIVISQSQTGFQEVNPSLRGGIDLSVIYDVPHEGWMAPFEPQHAAFLVTRDLEFGFAFKWYFLIAASFFGGAVFAHSFARLPASLSLLLGAFWCLSPFLHWWFQSQAFLVATYAMLVLTMLRSALEQSSLPKRLALGLGAGYLAAAAITIQYPPFLIGAALPSLVVFGGLLVNKVRAVGLKPVAGRVLPVLAMTALVAGAVGVGYIIDKGATISEIGASEHPGGRSYTSGLADLTFAEHLLSSNLAPELLDDTTAANYFLNQSEASDFILILPYLTVFGAWWLVAQWRKQRTLDPLLAGLIGFSALLGIWLFVPGLSTVFIPLLLSNVPLNRFVYMLGVTQFFLIVQLISLAREQRLKSDQLAIRYAPAIVTGLAAMATLAANRATALSNPGFINGGLGWAIATAAFIGGLFLLLRGKSRAGLALLVGLAVASVATINPVYRGLDIAVDTAIVDRIEVISKDDPEANWAVIGGLPFENLAVAAGVPSVTGSAPYTQLDFWAEHYSPAPEAEFVYDRSAHFFFEATDEKTELVLLQKNLVSVHLNPCDAGADLLDIGYIVSTVDLDRSCLSLLDTIEYPMVTFFIYKRE